MGGFPLAPAPTRGFAPTMPAARPNLRCAPPRRLRGAGPPYIARHYAPRWRYAPLWALASQRPNLRCAPPRRLRGAGPPCILDHLDEVAVDARVGDELGME